MLADIADPAHPKCSRLSKRASRVVLLSYQGRANALLFDSLIPRDSPFFSLSYKLFHCFLLQSHLESFI